MSDRDTKPKSLTDTGDRILSLIDALDERLARIEKLLEEIRDQIAKCSESERRKRGKRAS
jgi:hypothetical protein